MIASVILKIVCLKLAQLLSHCDQMANFFRLFTENSSHKIKKKQPEVWSSNPELIKLDNSVANNSPPCSISSKQAVLLEDSMMKKWPFN